MTKALKPEEDLEEMVSRIGRSVFEAAMTFEPLEDAGLVSGNGHHLAQEVAGFAVELLRERWRGSQDEDSDEKQGEGNEP